MCNLKQPIILQSTAVNTRKLPAVTFRRKYLFQIARSSLKRYRCKTFDSYKNIVNMTIPAFCNEKWKTKYVLTQYTRHTSHLTKLHSLSNICLWNFNKEASFFQICHSGVLNKWFKLLRKQWRAHKVQNKVKSVQLRY